MYNKQFTCRSAFVRECLVNNYSIESIAKVELEPMGIYSKKIRSLSELKENATIAVPNDPKQLV